MRIEVIADRGHVRRWQLWLVEALRALSGCHVTVSLEHVDQPLPSGLAALLSFERLIGMAHLESATDAIPAAVLQVPGDDAQPADLIIDLSGAPNLSNRPAQTLAPLFDGSPAKEAFWSALLDGRAPWLEIADNRRQRPITIGLPALEAPHHVCDSADAVLSRLVEGLVRAVGLVAKGNAASHASCEPPPQSSARASSPVTIAEFAASQVKRKALRALDGLLQGGRRWSVAWRRTNNRRPPRGATLRVEDFQTLRDDGRRFYADPFVLHHGGLHHVFVEELPYATGRGIISHFTIDAAGRVSAPRQVLERPYHLSYPHVFVHDGQIWMLPESPGRAELELYRADPFPDRWVLEARLIDGQLHDATIFEDMGRLWLFAASEYRHSSTWDALSLYSAERLTGPWAPHPLNPVHLDVRSARPAGALFRSGGDIWRPVQDCSGGYGSALGFARVTRLDAGGYAQELHGRLSFPASSGILGPHTLNWADDIEVIDLFSRR